MSSVSILGAGPIGAAVAQRLAESQRVRLVTLIDERGAVAAGKALDIRQSGPVCGFDTAVASADSALDALSADVVVVADEFDGGDWRDERGLALVDRLLRAGLRAPLVFAGPSQTWLMEAAAAELHVPADRLVGSAASALVGTVRSLTALEIDAAGQDVELAIAGRPGAFVVAWSSATAGASLVTDRVPPHRLLAISDALGGLWPPGPQAIAAPTAAIAHALIAGSRRRHQAMAIPVAPGAVETGQAAMLLLDLGRGRILGHAMPSLSPQERVRAGRHVR